MTVTAVVHLRDQPSGGPLAGWVELVATGARVPVRSEAELVSLLHRLVAEANGSDHSLVGPSNTGGRLSTWAASPSRASGPPKP